METQKLDDRIRKYALKLAIIEKKIGQQVSLRSDALKMAEERGDHSMIEQLVDRQIHEAPFGFGIQTALNMLYHMFPELEQTVNKDIEKYKDPKTGIY